MYLSITGHRLQRPPSHNSGHCGGGEPKLVRQGYRQNGAPHPVRRTCVNTCATLTLADSGSLCVSCPASESLHTVASSSLPALQPGPGHML